MSARRVTALVPMRDQSERVPRKNLRDFNGRPLYHWVVAALAACPRVAEIVVDTDSAAIAADLARNFPAVRVLERPEALRGGDVPMNEIIVHDVTVIGAELYLQTHSTNPLLDPATIERAIGRFLDERPAIDSLFGVTRLRTRLWDERGHPLNHDPNRLLRTQDLPPVFEENSCLYLFEAELARLRRNRIGERPALFEIDSEEAWDIDEEIDFAIAEFLHRRRAEAKS
jgi:CMP-N-acetylneuraminic acid synthetase